MKWEENGSDPIYLGCQQRQSSDLFLLGAWIVSQGCWRLWAGKKSFSQNKTPFSNLGLRKNHFPALDQMTDQFHILPAFPTYQCMHVSAQLPYVPFTAAVALPPPLSHYGKLYLSTPLFSQLFKSVMLTPANSQATKLSEIFVWSTYCFSLGHPFILSSLAVLWHQELGHVLLLSYVLLVTNSFWYIILPAFSRAFKCT